MFLVDNYLPATARGCCYLCGASKRDDAELIVDTNITIDFEGRLAVCGSCVRQMAGLVGMVDVERVGEVERRLDVLSAALAEATERADAADAAVEANFAYLSARDAHVNVLSGSAGQVPVSETVAEEVTAVMPPTKRSKVSSS